MTTSINGMNVDIPVPVQTARASAPVVITTGVTDLAAIARQQLQSAVAAPTLIAAYSTKTAPQSKPVARNATPQPSSQLAAQLIAQDGEVSTDDLAIFEPRAIPDSDAPEPIAGHYLQPSIEPAPAQTAVTPTNAGAELAGETPTAQHSALDVVLHESADATGFAQLAVAVPSFLSKFLRRHTIAQSRGVEAYQLAATRNAVSLATSNLEAGSL